MKSSCSKLEKNAKTRKEALRPPFGHPWLRLIPLALRPSALGHRIKLKTIISLLMNCSGFVCIVALGSIFVDMLNRKDRKKFHQITDRPKTTQPGPTVSSPRGQRGILLGSMGFSSPPSKSCHSPRRTSESAECAALVLIKL